MNLVFYVNGKWVESSQATVPFNDAGFLLGDGLFETIRFHNGHLFKLEQHLKRLDSGLSLIKIKKQQTHSELGSLLQETITKNELESGLLRLMITRGELIGEPWKFTGNPCIYISIRPLSDEPQDMPVKVVFFKEEDYPIIRFKPAIKSMNYIGNMLAKKDAETQGAYEPVFINSDGLITECAIRNIFFIKDKTLLTPLTDLGILPGVMRDTIIEIAHNSELAVTETEIHIDELNEMDEAFISSSGIGLYPCEWKNWNSEYKFTLKIKDELFRQIYQTTTS